MYCILDHCDDICALHLILTHVLFLHLTFDYNIMYNSICIFIYICDKVKKFLLVTQATG